MSGDGVSVLSDAAKVAFVEDNFPFAVSQEGLQEDFQVGTDVCDLGLNIPLNLDTSPDEPGVIPRLGSGE